MGYKFRAFDLRAMRPKKSRDAVRRLLFPGM